MKPRSKNASKTVKRSSCIPSVEVYPVKNGNSNKDYEEDDQIRSTLFCERDGDCYPLLEFTNLSIGQTGTL